jgi:hypothetical protein
VSHNVYILIFELLNLTLSSSKRECVYIVLRRVLFDNCTAYGTDQEVVLACAAHEFKFLRPAIIINAHLLSHSFHISISYVRSTLLPIVCISLHRYAEAYYAIDPLAVLLLVMTVDTTGRTSPIPRHRSYRRLQQSSRRSKHDTERGHLPSLSFLEHSSSRSKI